MTGLERTIDLRSLNTYYQTSTNLICYAVRFHSVPISFSLDIRRTIESSNSKEQCHSRNSQRLVLPMRILLNNSISNRVLSKTKAQQRIYTITNNSNDFDPHALYCYYLDVDSQQVESIEH